MPSRCVLLHLWKIYDGKVPLQRERFHQNSLLSLLWHKVRGPRRDVGTSQGLQAMYRNFACLDPEKSLFHAVQCSYGMVGTQKSTQRLLFLHGGYNRMESAKEEKLVLILI